MCKQDVRIARAAAPEAANQWTGGDGNVRKFGANPNRYSLVLGLEMANQVTDTCIGMAWTESNGERIPLLGVSIDHPVDRCTIMDVGQALLGDIWVGSVGASNPDFLYLGQTFFNQDLESIP